VVGKHCAKVPVRVSLKGSIVHISFSKMQYISSQCRADSPLADEESFVAWPKGGAVPPFAIP
jgi:hypothetical protein